AARVVCARTEVGGVSPGALLPFLLAARRSKDVTAVIACAAPLILADYRPALLRWLRWLPPIQRRFAMIPKPGGRDIGDPVARAASRSYDVMPLAALLSLLHMRRVVRRELPRVTQPTLVLHGRFAPTAPPTTLALLH